MSDLDDQAEERLIHEAGLDFDIQREKRKMDRTIRGCEFDEVIAELRGEVERLKEQVKELNWRLNRE